MTYLKGQSTFLWTLPTLQEILRGSNPHFYSRSPQDEWDALVRNYMTQWHNLNSQKFILVCHQRSLNQFPRGHFGLKHESRSSILVRCDGWSCTWILAAQDWTTVCTRMSLLSFFRTQYQKHRMVHMMCVASTVLNMRENSQEHKGRSLPTPSCNYDCWSPAPTIQQSLPTLNVFP